MENHDMENARPALNHVGTGQARENYGKILTTPEAIVREHRERWAKRERRTVLAVDGWATPINGEINQINRKLRILNARWKFMKLFRSINWNVAIELLCWGLVIVALTAIIGVVVFGPTSWREFWK